MRILLVEDNPVNAQLATSLLERLGHKIEAVENGQEAIAAFRPEKHDVVLMDLHMPVVDGFQATKELLKRYPEAVIIALTADAFLTTRTKCLEAGMRDFLTKPIGRKTLKEALENVVTKPAETAAMNAPTSDEGGTGDPKKVDIDLDLFLSLTTNYRDSGIMEVYEEVVAELRELPGQLAVDRAAGNDHAFVQRAHTMRGSASTFGMTGVAESLNQLEQAVKAETPLASSWQAALQQQIQNSVAKLAGVLSNPGV